MAIHLIGEKEKRTVEIGGSKFHYRRIRAAERQRIIRRNTTKKTFQVDYTQVGIDVVKLCLLGWENVMGDDGKPIEYSADLVEILPETVLMSLQGAMSSFGDDDEEMEEAEKN